MTSRYIHIERIGSADLSSTGIAIQEFVDPHLVASCMARVTWSPNFLPYTGWYSNWYKQMYGKTKPAALVNKMRHWNRTSTEVMTTCEVKPGDLVLLRHIANLEQRDFVSYDELIARIEPDGNLYPLNCQLLIRMDEHSRVENGINVVEDRKYENAMDRGVVIAEGRGAPSYLAYPHASDNFEGRWTGRRVFFREGMAVRIESDMNPQLKYKTPWPYYRLWRYNVLGYV